MHSTFKYLILCSALTFSHSTFAELAGKDTIEFINLQNKEIDRIKVAQSELQANIDRNKPQDVESQIHDLKKFNIEKPTISQRVLDKLDSIKRQSKITGMDQREQDRGKIVAKIDQVLSNMNDSEEKYIFILGLNSTIDGNFHVNDNISLNLTQKDKEYFDLMYVVALMKVKKALSVKGADRASIILQTERDFPFKIFPDDLAKLMQ